MRQFATIDQRRFGKEFLRHGHGLDRLLDFPFEIVTLVDHVCDIGRFAGFPFEVANLVEDAKHLIRIDGPEGQIVVGIAAIVKVKAAQHVFRQQPGNDLLDVLRRIVMSGVDQDFRLRAGGAREKQRHAPIGDIGVVKGGLKRLVLDQKSLSGRQRLMRFLQQLREPLLALPDIRGSGIV